MLEWGAIGLPLQCGMLLPTKRYLHQLERDGFISLKAAKLKQSMMSCSLKKKGGVLLEDTPLLTITTDSWYIYFVLIVTVVHTRKLLQL